MSFSSRSSRSAPRASSLATFAAELVLGVGHPPFLARDLLPPRAQVLLGLPPHRGDLVLGLLHRLLRGGVGLSLGCQEGLLGLASAAAPGPRCSGRSTPRSTCGRGTPPRIRGRGLRRPTSTWTMVPPTSRVGRGPCGPDPSGPRRVSELTSAQRPARARAAPVEVVGRGRRSEGSQGRSVERRCPVGSSRDHRCYGRDTAETRVRRPSLRPRRPRAPCGPPAERPRARTRVASGARRGG